MVRSPASTDMVDMVGSNDDPRLAVLDALALICIVWLLRLKVFQLPTWYCEIFEVLDWIIVS